MTGATLVASKRANPQAVSNVRGTLKARQRRGRSGAWNQWPVVIGFLSVETMGLEPTTSCLQSRRSAGLSYVPGMGWKRG